ncbi:Rrf2 family transcriptional regulator, group III [Anaerovibrio sp. JC8]|uniref:Rrf2 family transcriptional regulator n=1 Tax=Anaerovibrio sp. JC8 TaxID=1240085 RepID=UPI000A0CA22F|nr:Rrf2 family transcriptional regulator [Anaerovibrio sp. JC8]ORT99371.1 Rrf2 family transcriptional regulator, group III [Anaerovibrio sp. JC8]
MQFSFRMPVAVQILLCVAKFDGVFKTTSTFLASSVNINPVIIRKTLGQLKSAGLVEVAAGVGGAKLTKQPCEITLQEIFNAVEDDEDLFHIQDNPNPNCPVGRNIQQVLGNKLSVIKNNMLDDFAKITLEDLLDDINKAEQSR